jgi:ABC-type branched-subunit amino acid transport system substrate-binding protein
MRKYEAALLRSRGSPEMLNRRSPIFTGLEGGLFLLVPGLTLLLSPMLPAAPLDLAGTNLVIGLLLPPEQSESASIRDGVTLAVEEANTNPAAHVRLVTRGRVGQWGADAVEAARMVTDDGATGLIAPPNGAATHLLLQVAGRTAVPVLSLCADASVTQTGVPWMLRLVPTTVQEAHALLRGLQNDGRATSKRCIALVPDGRAGREITRDLKHAFANTDFMLEKVIELKPATNEFKSITRQVLNVQAGVALIWLDPIPAGTAVKALRTAGFQGTLAGPGRLHSAEFLTSAGKASEGFLFTELTLDAADEAKFHAFRTAFQHRFEHEPDPISTFSYDAASLLIHILETSGAQASRAFPLRISWPGASGRLSFDAQGNRSAEFRLVVLRSGAERIRLTEAGKEER